MKPLEFNLPSLKAVSHSPQDQQHRKGGSVSIEFVVVVNGKNQEFASKIGQHFKTEVKMMI